MGVIGLQLILYEYGEKERGDEADSLGHANLPRGSVTVTVSVEVRGLVQADFLNIKRNGHRLGHNGNS